MSYLCKRIASKKMGRSLADKGYGLLSRIGFQLWSWNTMGYGIHSPYLFYIARALVPETEPYYCFREVENVRRRLLTDSSRVYVDDYGTGVSGVRSVQEVARASVSSRRKGQLLFRLVNHSHARRIVELGTSLGLTTAYLALPSKEARVQTFEGSTELLRLAEETWAKTGVKNVVAVQGNIDETLPIYVRQADGVDFAFLDANHRGDALVRYFDMLASLAHERTIFAVDDIRYSRSMYAGWRRLCSDERVSASFDLGEMGLLFFDGHLPKATFRIRM